MLVTIGYISILFIMKDIEAIIIVVCLLLTGFLFSLLFAEYFINKLSEENRFKIWWRNNIIGIDNDYE